MITKQLIKIFDKNDPRRVLFNTELEKLEKELAAKTDKPEWVKKHGLGVNAVLTLSIFWAIAIGPIEAVAKEERTKMEGKVIRKFYEFVDKAKITRATIQHPIGTSLDDRLAAMAHMDQD